MTLEYSSLITRDLSTHTSILQMHLASQCREAISHVAVLKRELELQQQRAAEALSFQRQQTQQMALVLSEKLQSEDAVSTTPLSLSQLPSHLKQASPTQTKILAQTSTLSTSPESNTSSSSLSECYSENDTVDQRQHNSTNISSSTLSSSSLVRDDSSSYAPTPSPMVYYSTPKKRSTIQQVSPNGDDIHSPIMNLFPSSASPNIKLQSRGEYDDELPSYISDPTLTTTANPLSVLQAGHQDDEDTSSSTSSADQRDNIGTRSIDEFEASFDTTFPTNFPVLAEQASGMDLDEAPAYDPFALFAASPDRSSVRELDGYLEPTDDHDSPDRSASKCGPWNTDLALHNIESYGTPPTKGTSDSSSMSEEQPKRPEKTPSAEARAKYDRALQPRTSVCAANGSTQVNPEDTATRTSPQPVSPSLDDAHAPPGPSPLLKRIQERRMKKQLSRQHSMPSPHVQKPGFNRHHSAPEASKDGIELIGADKPLVSAESRLNIQSVLSINGCSTTDTTTKILQRRSVKQPISYSEPALNTKLRQGHVYFQKEQE